MYDPFPSGLKIAASPSRISNQSLPNASRMFGLWLTTSGEIDLRGILEGMDRSLLTGLQRTIEARDLAAFSKAYRDTLSGCYACHQASEKPYLRLRVPEAPEGRMIEFSLAGSEG